MTTTAGAVAIELRKLADHLDENPNAVVPKPWMHFHADTKDQFVATARLLPRPLKKGHNNSGDERWARVHVEHESPSLDVKTSVYKSLTCELVEAAKPAVFRCDPILSEFEINEVSA